MWFMNKATPAKGRSSSATGYRASLARDWHGRVVLARFGVAVTMAGLTGAGGLVVAGAAQAQDVVAAQASSPAAVPASPSIGTVKTVAGQAYMEFQGQRVPLKLGMPVTVGARIVTGPGSTLGITFRDETVMSIGPNTQLVVDQYLYEPSQGQLGLVAQLLRGTLNYVSGQIAKLKPDAVNVNTPTGMIGVRGTQFVVKVDPEAGTAD